MKSHHLQKASTDRIIFYIIGGFTLVVLLFIGIFSWNESKQTKSAGSVTYYTTQDTEKPKVEINSTFSDLGTMKVKDEKTAQFTIANKGNKSLQLSQISSSCDCTYGQVTIDRVKSPEFSMHSKNPWVGTLDPGKTATLDVIYRPFVMPVKGVVTRDVYMTTNDPEKPSLTFSIKAFVE